VLGSRRISGRGFSPPWKHAAGGLAVIEPGELEPLLAASSPHRLPPGQPR